MTGANPTTAAAIIGGIRQVQPRIGASSIEALLHIAGGADCSTELQQRMGIDHAHASRIISQLTGRGTIGKRGRRSQLALVQRRRHPHRRGAQLLLTPDAQALLSSTFALANPCESSCSPPSASQAERVGVR